MAGPYLLSCTKPLKCPSDSSKLFVKHVVLKKDQDLESYNSDPQPREVKNSLMINEMFAEGGKQNVWNNLLMIQFSSYSEDEINEILSGAIEIDGSQYCFLGFSESQLRDKTCFLIKETEKQISKRRARLGNFTSVIPFADRVATVQHMFEPFEKSLQLAKGEFTFKHHSNHLPSGFMAPELAEKIRTKYSLAEEPSVVQVICPGFSGKLVLSNKIGARASEESLSSEPPIEALFKIPDGANNRGDQLTVGVVECAKPYQVGYLDVYSVTFLEERGVAREYLLKLQRHYHEVLKKLGQADLTHSKYFLRLTGRQELLSKIENGIADDAKRKISKIKEDEVKSMRNETTPELRVFVRMSRVVFGIEDPYKEDQDKALKPDECVFIPCLDRMNDQEKELFESAEQLLVIPQPCYTSTDIHVMTLASVKDEYKILKDCLVLPSQPEAQAVANKYFVSWDRNLLTQKSDSYREIIANALPELYSQILKKLTTLSSLLCSREHTPTGHRYEKIETTENDTECFEEMETNEKDTECFEEMETNEKDTGCFEEMETNDKDPKTASKLDENGSFQDDLKRYFATYKSSDDLVSRAKDLFKGFAALHDFGPLCSECKKLGEYLSPSFDWNARREETKNSLKRLDNKYQKLRPKLEGGQKSETQSPSPRPVWREMTKVLSEFIAFDTSSNE